MHSLPVETSLAQSVDLRLATAAIKHKQEVGAQSAEAEMAAVLRTPEVQANYDTSFLSLKSRDYTFSGTGW